MTYLLPLHPFEHGGKKRDLYEGLKRRSKVFHGIAPLCYLEDTQATQWSPDGQAGHHTCLASLRKTTTEDQVTFQSHLTLPIEAAQVLSTGLEFWGFESWPKWTGATEKQQALGTVSVSIQKISDSSHPRMSKSLYRLIQICWVNINSLKNGLRTWEPFVQMLVFCFIYPRYGQAFKYIWKQMP